jgi:hypothetical protein
MVLYCGQQCHAYLFTTHFEAVAVETRMLQQAVQCTAAWLAATAAVLVIQCDFQWTQQRVKQQACSIRRWQQRQLT